jgi:hypothetical protein
MIPFQVFNERPSELPKARLQDVFFGENVNEGLQQAPRNKAIVADDGSLYSLTTTNYNLITHDELLDSVESVLAKHPEFGQYSTQIKLSLDGARLVAEYTFDNIEHTIANGDNINPSVRVSGSYDLGWMQRMDFGAFRLLCSNGLIVGDLLASYHRRHTNSLSIDAMKSILSEGMGNYSNQVELWRSWVDTVLEKSRDEIQDDIRELGFTKKQSEEILDNEPEVGEETTITDKLRTQDPLTKWFVYNVVCQYLSHRVENMDRMARVYEKLQQW